MMNLKTVDPKELKFWDKNYNAHPGDQVEILADGLKTFDQYKNVVIWQDKVIAGEGLVRAALASGIFELVVNDVSHLSEAEALALMTHDNESARKSKPDPIKLAGILEEIGDLAQIPAVTDDDLSRIVAEAMLAKQVAQELSGNDQMKRTERMLGDRAKQIKPVLYVDELVDFERAILATGLKNRGQAVIEICRAYLARQTDGEQGTERQQYLPAEGAVAAKGA